MNYYWILWSFDAIIALVVVYFFVLGIADGTVSSFNMTLWLGILFALVVILGGSLLLKNYGYLAWAKTILYLLAVPGIIYLLFILFMIIGKPRMN